MRARFRSNLRALKGTVFSTEDLGGVVVIFASAAELGPSIGPSDALRGSSVSTGSCMAGRRRWSSLMTSGKRIVR